MKISTVRNLLLGTAFATTLTGCGKKAFTEAKHVEPFTQELVDTLSVYSKSILQDPAYKCYGKDTLALGKDFQKDPRKFLKTINDSAEAKAPKELVDAKLVLVNTPFGRTTKCVEIRKPVYNETNAVITSPKIFEKDGEQFVPVEYWGR